jgi:hypothetical protein
LKAKTSTASTVYVLEPSLSGTFLTGEGENIDKIRFTSATGGVHIRNNRQLTGAALTLSSSQYSYLYGEIGRSFIPNLLTENASKKTTGNNSGSIGYYQNGVVDNFTVNSSTTWTDTYPWATGERKATARLQIPYLLGYEKGPGQTRTWLHENAAGDDTYTEYMLDLSYVLGTDLAKTSTSKIDGIQVVAIAQEAVYALENVLPQQVPGPKAFAAAPAPTITGTVKVGQTLTAEPGTWSPWPAFSYQWYADGQPIAGATQSQYQITASDVGKSFTVVVTATASGYITTKRTSAQTAAVPEDTTVTAKVFTTAPVPTISGVAKVGNTLGLDTGSWKPWPAGAAFSFQWYADGKAISGATKNQYKIAASDVGKKLTVSVTATAPEYDTATKTSDPTAKVVANKFVKSPVPKITGTAKVGKTLKVKVGTWSPKAKYAYQWYANGKAIKGATKATLKLKKAQKGKKITVKVTGKKSGYNAVTKTSKATKKVR